MHYDPGKMIKKKSLFKLIQTQNSELNVKEKQSHKHLARDERNLQGHKNQMALEVELQHDCLKMKPRDQVEDNK